MSYLSKSAFEPITEIITNRLLVAGFWKKKKKLDWNGKLVPIDRIRFAKKRNGHEIISMNLHGIIWTKKFWESFTVSREVGAGPY